MLEILRDAVSSPTQRRGGNKTHQRNKYGARTGSAQGNRLFMYIFYIIYIYIYIQVRDLCQILGKWFKAWVWIPLGLGESLRPADGINTFVTVGGSWCQLTNSGFQPGWVISTLMVQGPQTQCRHSPTTAKQPQVAASTPGVTEYPVLCL